MEGYAPMRSRRRFLLSATTALGTAGFAGAAAPFFMSMLPSARARAAAYPVVLDPSRIEPGMLIRTEWRSQPVFVLHRTPAMLDSLKTTDSLVADPTSEQPQQPPYCHNEYRSTHPEWFVVVAICTHLGCVPLPELKPGVGSGLGAAWPGGFFCPCHGSKYDLAGRVFQHVPAPLNLVVPPYELQSETKLVIGQHNQAA